MKRRIIIVFLGIAALAVLCFFSGSTLKSSTPFDSEVWEKHDTWQSSAYPRLSMADGLIKSGALKGLKKEQVLKMLGDPEDHGYFRSYDLVYWLGPERSFMGIDSEWLAITLNKKTGLVEDYKLVRD
jgi:hypothetical protein